MGVKLLNENHLEFLSLRGGCTGSSESTLVKYHIVGNHVSQLNYYDIFFMSNFYRAGWKRDWTGTWVRDEDAEFDSDEETPVLP